MSYPLGSRHEAAPVGLWLSARVCALAPVSSQSPASRAQQPYPMRYRRLNIYFPLQAVRSSWSWRPMFVRVVFPALYAILLVCLPAQAQQREPFSVEHLVRLQRVTGPALSPDGRTVVFTVRDTDMEANRGLQDLWIVSLEDKNSPPRRLTTHPEQDHSPQWSQDGKYIYFLSTRSGSSQVWRIPSSGGEAQQVTDLPLDVGSFRLAPN